MQLLTSAPVGRWLFTGGNRTRGFLAPTVNVSQMNLRGDVLNVQRALIDASRALVNAAFRCPCDGVISKDMSSDIVLPDRTVSAIEEFQEQVLGHKNPSGVALPKGEVVKGLENIINSSGLEKLYSNDEPHESGQHVSPVLRQRFSSFVARFGPVAVKSTIRDLHKQAELMAKMSGHTVQALYGHAGYADEIAALSASSMPLGSTTRATKVYQILKKHFHPPHPYISYHLLGEAIDVSAADPRFDWPRAKEIAAKCLLHVNDKEQEVKELRCCHLNRSELST